VAESCVVGLPDAEWGAVVAAAIVSVRGPDGDEADLSRHVRLSLAGYKVPQRFMWLSDLPRTGTGKPRREAIRRLFDARRSEETSGS